MGGTLNVHNFSAAIDDEGKVEGRADCQLRHLALHVQIEVDCLSVIENDAWMSGTIRESTDPALLGQPVLFRVQDNDFAHDASVGGGEAEGVDEDDEGFEEPDAFEMDMTSQVVIGGPAVECDSAPTLELVTWTNGDVGMR